MKILAHTTKQTNATPASIFSLWADVNNWAEHDQGIEWAKLTDTFAVGGHYILKPKGGPKVNATIEVVEPNTRFVDVSHLFGAKLRFDHGITVQDGKTIVTMTMDISGPMAWFWTMVLGKNQQADLETSTANLIAKAEK